MENKKNHSKQAQGTANAKETKQFVREKGRGTVKAVLSGDTIVVLHIDKSHQGPPVERQITLSSIQAPFLGRKRGETKQPDEPFAWASRNFLRKKLIGKQVTYTIEYKNPQSNKEYGTLTLENSTQTDNIGLLVVSNGWATVKRPNIPKDAAFRPEIQELIEAEEQAKAQEKGKWTKSDEAITEAIRPQPDNNNPATLFNSMKSQPVTGVVERVNSGSCLKVILTPSFHEITLYLSGVQAPDFNSEGSPEPFAREAKFFTEHHILNRDVTIILEAVDKNALYGSVSYMSRNLSEELLKNGLAQYVEWSGAKTAFAEKLKAAEKAAKDAGQRIWLNYQPKTKQAEKKVVKSGKEIFGKVIDVSNGGTISVLDDGGELHKVNLSSVRVYKNVQLLSREQQKKEEQAKAGKQDKKVKDAVERAYAWEAKEYLRRRTIGQRVRCVLDYSRPPPQNQNQNQQKGKPQKEEDRLFYSVYFDKNNVAVELAEQGFAYAQEHRGAEERSKDYDQILLAEERAKKLHRGVHAPEDKAPVLYVNDLSVADISKARNFLPFLKRSGRQRGVVEFEFSATKLKLYVPKESAFIIFAISGLRGPGREDKFYKESVFFVKQFLHQRDIEFDVINQDKGGNFVGNIWVNKKNFATILLEEGYAEIHQGSIRDNENSTEYLIAEESAKRSKKRIWKNYDPKVEQEKRKKNLANREEQKKQKQEFVDVVITEIIDGSRFFVQIAGPEAEQLEELMGELNVETSDQVYNPLIGELVKAQFTLDDAWYRGKVTKITAEKEYEIFFIDYGNNEILPASRLRPLDPAFKKLDAQAHEAQLAYVTTPTLEEEYGVDAAIYLKELTAGKTMLANVEYRDNNKMFLSLGDRESQIHVNAALLRAGLGRVERITNRQLQPLIDKLREEEDKAKASHSFIWQYGDPGFDEDEEDTKSKKQEKKTKPKPEKPKA